MKRREDAEEHARGHRDPGGKEQHLPGKARRGRIDRAERKIGRHDADGPAENHEPRDAAQSREQTRLEQQLAYELTAARANREPHGHLRRAAGGAREQQVRDVGARDEQNDQRDDLEDRERRTGPHEHVTLSATPVRQRHTLSRELRLLRVGEPFLQRQLLLDEIGVGHADAGARGLHRHTGLETREEIGPVVLTFFETGERRLHRGTQRDRHEELRARAARRPVESARRHADDGERLTVHDERPAEHVRILLEARDPVVFREHGHRRGAGRGGVLRRDQPPERRRQPKHVEVAARDLDAVDRQRLIVVPDVRAEDPVRGDARKDLLVARQVQEHRVGKDGIAVARVVARVRAVLDAGRPEIDQRLRRLDRQRAQENLVEQRKNRGVRADAEPQREHRHRRDKRRLAQHPEGERELAHRRGDGVRLTPR